MLSDNILKELMDIKEVPSNLSQDKMRTVYNENFRKMRKLIQEIVQESQNNVNVIRNLNIIFPTSPDERLQYIMKYNSVNSKWYVTEFLGTQNILGDGDAVKVGSKHQHIVNDIMQIGVGAEIIIDEGGQVVVQENTSSLVVAYTILDPLDEMVMTYDYTYNGINQSETLNPLTVTKNGSTVVNSGDVITTSDYITISTGDNSDLNKKVYVSISKVL